MQSPSEIRDAHQKRFGSKSDVFVAPGRVNLIGEHTDYSEGFVMPAAIEFATLAAISAREDNKVVIFTQNFNEQVEHDSDEIAAKGSDHWSDYPLGVLTILRRSGVEVPPFSMTIDGDVPLGSGLSSSASIEVATMLAMLSLTQAHFPLQEIARLCQRVENEYVGANSGIMDQFVSCCGAAGHALLLDCRDLAYRLAPIPDGVSIVICNTMVKHSIAGGDYNTRRAEIEAGADIVRKHRPEVQVMRDVTLEDLAKWGAEMPPNVLKRCRHVVTENLRTVAAADALERGDLETLGRLMAEAHVSYRDDFEASCKEADILVELAGKQPGLIGARLTGGGFGGCTVNLVESAGAAIFAESMKAGYLAATGIHSEVYLTVASAGAHQV